MKQTVSMKTGEAGIHDKDYAVEIVKDRLYFACCVGKPKSTASAHFFSVDELLRYQSFCNDFGPHSLGHLYRFCRALYQKMKRSENVAVKIVFFTSFCEKMRSNAAFLIGAYQVLFLDKTAEQAYEPLSSMNPPFIPFRDASVHCSPFPLSVKACIQGIERAFRQNLLDLHTFDVLEYEYYEKIENGDINFVVPNKILAFAGPQSEHIGQDGCISLTPSDFIEVFKSFGVSTVVRLNEKAYDAEEFTTNGFEHHDLFIVDGMPPSQEDADKFLDIAIKAKGVVAVHCKAGLGRTGTCIALYLMRVYGWSAVEAIAWVRICRPGSVIGPQHQYLVREYKRMHALYKMSRKRHSWAQHLLSMPSKRLVAYFQDKSRPKRIPNSFSSLNLAKYSRVDTMSILENTSVFSPRFDGPASSPPGSPSCKSETEMTDELPLSHGLAALNNEFGEDLSSSTISFAPTVAGSPDALSKSKGFRRVASSPAKLSSFLKNEVGTNRTRITRKPTEPSDNGPIQQPKHAIESTNDLKDECSVPFGYVESGMYVPDDFESDFYASPISNPVAAAVCSPPPTILSPVVQPSSSSSLSSFSLSASASDSCQSVPSSATQYAINPHQTSVSSSYNQEDIQKLAASSPSTILRIQKMNRAASHASLDALRQRHEDVTLLAKSQSTANFWNIRFAGI